MSPSPFNFPYESCYASLIKFALSVGFSALFNYSVSDKVFDNWTWLENSLTVLEFWWQPGRPNPVIKPTHQLMSSGNS